MKDSIYSWIRQKYQNTLPENIKVIAPESSISSYSLMKIADVGLVFASTTGLGLEMALLNKPVIVVGKVHYWDRGFTLDPRTEDEYYCLLNEILIENKKKEISIALAKKFAHFIIFDVGFKLKSFSTRGFLSFPSISFSSYEDLLPGKDQSLDLICDGISNGRKFVLDKYLKN